MVALAESYNKSYTDAAFEIVVATPDEYLRALAEAVDAGAALSVSTADFSRRTRAPASRRPP